MRHLDDAERRRRLVVRHAHRGDAHSPHEAALAVVALHSTDPVAMTLAVAARTGAATSEPLDRALYRDRTLVRLLAMRRTVFAVPVDEVPDVLGATRAMAANQRRVTVKLLRDGGIEGDVEDFLARAERAALDFVAQAGEFTSADLAAADPILATRFTLVPAGAGASQSVASRLLTMLSADGTVLRASVVGDWTSVRFRWAGRAHWLPELPPVPDAATASSAVARRWLARYGPATPADLQWWTGWTKGATTAALAGVATEEVEAEDGPALVLEGDAEPTPDVEPTVALLPGLDPSAMGWRERGFHLGDLGPRVFDTVGNAGPTVWVDGRIVGGWAVRDDGTVGLDLALPRALGREHHELLGARVAALETFLAGTVVKPRARRWTTAERASRGEAAAGAG